MKEYLLTTLSNSRAYTMQVADAMPEKDYSFRPVDSIWNYGELLQHIAYGIQWWESNYIRKVKMEWAPPPFKTGKEKAKKYLEEAYVSLENSIKEQKADEETVKGFFATLDHITHHRGQATIYLRCKGITPPDYAY